MTKQEFIDHMMSRGWEMDRWGHLRKDLKVPENGSVTRLRYKLNKISFTYQYKLRNDKEWRRRKIQGFYCTTAYFSWVGLTPEGKLYDVRCNKPT